LPCVLAERPQKGSQILWGEYLKPPHILNTAKYLQTQFNLHSQSHNGTRNFPNDQAEIGKPERYFKPLLDYKTVTTDNSVEWHSS
jgi:hypothetical protein